MSVKHSLPCVLLTGFDAFGGEPVNPSAESVLTLQGARLLGHRLVARQLPTSFARAPLVLRAALRELQPRAVICVGQAGGRAQISLERVAINVCDARIADNDGMQPHDIPVIARGPAAYFSRLPLDACLAALHDAGTPGEISNSAGTFVCNQVMYVLLHELRRQPQVRAGFVHIPFIPSQVLKRHGVASMTLDQISAALRRIVTATLDSSGTPRVTAATGREH